MKNPLYDVIVGDVDGAKAVCESQIRRKQLKQLQLDSKQRWNLRSLFKQQVT